MPSAHCPENVANGGDSTGVGVECHGTHNLRDYGHLGHSNLGDPLEGGRGAHYTRLRSSLQFHDILHGFRDRRGTGMAIMVLNLVQELSIVNHDPFFLVFLDL